jgi:hypothetical protein
MEGTPSPVKQHFTNTQFIGGMHYISRECIHPFDLYCIVIEEGMVLPTKYSNPNMVGVNKLEQAIERVGFMA